ncbi:MAG: hypothetical protein KKF44_10715 [Nanoarchaeota archaeon]|nr:hypothetical protein [Nanoarchaeota archaeon]
MAILPDYKKLDEKVVDALCKIAVGENLHDSDIDALTDARLSGRGRQYWTNYIGLKPNPGTHTVYYLGPATELYEDSIREQSVDLEFNTATKPRLTFLYHIREDPKTTRQVFVQVANDGGVHVDKDYKGYISHNLMYALQGYSWTWHNKQISDIANEVFSKYLKPDTQDKLHFSKMPFLQDIFYKSGVTYETVKALQPSTISVQK